MKCFIILEAVKNRRIDSLIVDLLPRLNTMPGSSRSLKCHVSICNELHIFV